MYSPLPAGPTGVTTYLADESGGSFGDLGHYRKALGLWEMSYLDALFLKRCTNTTRYIGHHPRPCLLTPHTEVGGLLPCRIQPTALAPIYVKERMCGV